jgi:hypothetical protein
MGKIGRINDTHPIFYGTMDGILPIHEAEIFRGTVKWLRVMTWQGVVDIFKNGVE